MPEKVCSKAAVHGSYVAGFSRTQDIQERVKNYHKYNNRAPPYLDIHIKVHRQLWVPVGISREGRLFSCALRNKRLWARSREPQSEVRAASGSMQSLSRNISQVSLLIRRFFGARLFRPLGRNIGHGSLSVRRPKDCQERQGVLGQNFLLEHFHHTWATWCGPVLTESNCNSLFFSHVNLKAMLFSYVLSQESVCGTSGQNGGWSFCRANHPYQADCWPSCLLYSAPTSRGAYHLFKELGSCDKLSHSYWKKDLARSATNPLQEGETSKKVESNLAWPEGLLRSLSNVVIAVKSFKLNKAFAVTSYFFPIFFLVRPPRVKAAWTLHVQGWSSR